jgi:hypothetical protein
MASIVKDNILAGRIAGGMRALLSDIIPFCWPTAHHFDVSKKHLMAPESKYAKK